MRVYGANAADMVSVCKYVKEKYVNICDICGYCETKPGKKAFAQLLADVSYGETVVIRALSALGDDSSTTEDIADRVRALCCKGVCLKVILDKDFSYETFEIWYSFSRRYSRSNGIWYKNYYEPDHSLQELEIEDIVPDYDPKEWEIGDFGAIWCK